MKTILFVNGCIRGEESRTLLLARRFLDWKEPFPAAVFLASVFRMLGIPKTDTVTAEGLDIIGNDVRLIMNQALREAELLAGTF